MWCSLRVASRFRTRGARLPAAAAAAAAMGAATAVATPWLARDVGVVSAQADASIGANRPLAPRHRVALCGWPIKGARQSSDPRVATLRSLFNHCREAGYDGIEMGCDDLKEMGFFSWSTPNHEVAAAVQREAAEARFPSTSRRGEIRAGQHLRATTLSSACFIVAVSAGPSTGVLYKVTDGNPAPFPGCLDFSDPRFEEAYKQKLRDDKSIGAEYVTFQIFLPPRYLNSAGTTHGRWRPVLIYCLLVMWLVQITLLCIGLAHQEHTVTTLPTWSNARSALPCCSGLLLVKA